MRIVEVFAVNLTHRPGEIGQQTGSMCKNPTKKTGTPRGDNKGGCVMRIQFILDDAADEDLIRWWLSLPKGQRAEELRKILRWYVVPGGFGVLVQALYGRSVSVSQSAPVKTSQVLADAMAQFGWDDDDD